MDEEEKNVTQFSEVKKKKEYKKRQDKKITFSYEEIQDKFSRTFNAIAFFLKIDKSYQESDFEEESKDLIRLAEKYPGIATILALLDPLFLILGLFSKIKEMLDKVKLKKKEEKEQK